MKCFVTLLFLLSVVANDPSEWEKKCHPFINSIGIHFFLLQLKMKTSTFSSRRIIKIPFIFFSFGNEARRWFPDSNNLICHLFPFWALSLMTNRFLMDHSHYYCICTIRAFFDQKLSICRHKQPLFHAITGEKRFKMFSAWTLMMSSGDQFKKFHFKWCFFLCWSCTSYISAKWQKIQQCHHSIRSTSTDFSYANIKSKRNHFSSNPF